MICDHLRPLEERILSRGFVESARGAPRPQNCREWVTYNVTMTLSRYPEDIRLHIDANSKTFAFEHAPEEKEPLASLIGRLEPLLPKPAPYIAPISSSIARDRLWALFMLIISLVFVAAALWIIVVRPPDSPVMAAWVGVVFFGACAVSAANDLRK